MLSCLRILLLDLRSIWNSSWCRYEAWTEICFSSRWLLNPIYESDYLPLADFKSLLYRLRNAFISLDLLLNFLFVSMDLRDQTPYCFYYRSFMMCFNICQVSRTHFFISKVLGTIVII